MPTLGIFEVMRNNLTLEEIFTISFMQKSGSWNDVQFFIYTYHLDHLSSWSLKYLKEMF